MTRSQTVDLLNETDNLESRMRWLLFQQEIAHIWNGPDQVAGVPVWRPGEPIYHPQETNVLDLDFDGYIEGSFAVRCTSCEVSWRGDDPCWSCGAEVPLYNSDYLRSIFGVHISFDVEVDMETITNGDGEVIGFSWGPFSAFNVFDSARYRPETPSPNVVWVNTDEGHRVPIVTPAEFDSAWREHYEELSEEPDYTVAEVTINAMRRSAGRERYYRGGVDRPVTEQRRPREHY